MNHINGFKRTSFALYKWLYTAVALLVVLMQPLAAYAATVTSTDITSPAGIFVIKDMTLDSAGTTHMVATAVDPMNGNVLSVNYFHLEEDTIVSTTIAAIITNTTTVGAEIKLDSNENPAIVWTEYRSELTELDVNYIAYSEGSWGASIEVANAISTSAPMTGDISFDFYKDGADVDEPYIVMCTGNDGTGLGRVREWNWTGAGFDAGSEVSGVTNGCFSVAVMINNSDDRFIIGGTFFGLSPDVWSAVNEGAGWTVTLFDDAYRDDAPGYVGATLHGEYPVFFGWRQAEAADADEALFGYYNGTIWTTTTIETGLNHPSAGELGNAAKRNIASDGSTIVAVYRVENGSGNTDLRYASSTDNGVTWSTSSVYTDETVAFNISHDVAYNSAATSFDILESILTGGFSLDVDQHRVSFSSGGGGGAGDPVPEMSTYLLILVGGLGAYMLYREADKIDFGGAAAA